MQSSKRHSLLFLLVIISAPTKNCASLTHQPQAYVAPQPLKTESVTEEALPLPPSGELTIPHAKPADEAVEKRKEREAQEKQQEELDPEENDTEQEEPLEPSATEEEAEEESVYDDQHEELADDNYPELAPEEEIGEWNSSLEDDEEAQESFDEQETGSKKLDATLEEEKRDRMVAEEITYSAAPQHWSPMVNRQPESQPTAQVAPSYHAAPFTEMFNAPESEEFQVAMNDALESFGITPEQAQEAMENATEEDIRQGMELAAKIIQDIETERQLAEQESASMKNKSPKL